ncbi:hypothetical protein H671_1g1804 [Cricetulus griseus]|nr:hypothetical protein H671_1g1804 [Cricetulus griseus]
MLFSYFNVLWFSASKGGTSRPEGCPLPLHTETCSHKMEASWRKGAHPAKATPEDKWRRWSLRHRAWWCLLLIDVSFIKS